MVNENIDKKTVAIFFGVVQISGIAFNNFKISFSVFLEINNQLGFDLHLKIARKQSVYYYLFGPTLSSRQLQNRTQIITCNDSNGR